MRGSPKLGRESTPHRCAAIPINAKAATIATMMRNIWVTYEI